MSAFDEQSEDFKNLPDSFQRMVRLVNRSKNDLSAVKSKEIIDRQFKLIEKFVSLPTSFAFVVDINAGDQKNKPWAIILYNGRLQKVRFLTDDDKNILPGNMVEVSSKTLQIIGPADIKPSGNVAIVKRLINDQMCEVYHQNESRVVFRGLFSTLSANLQIEIGDRVIIDSSAVMILDNLGKEQNKFKLSFKPTITWDDIVGLEEAKEKLIEIIEFPYTHAELFKHHNKKQVKGILLLGPPGCGKSMLIEAAASAMAKIHGQEALDSGYIYVKAAELLEELVGRGEKNIKFIFERAEEHMAKHGYPAIIAIEEPDAVFIKRGTGKSSDVERSMVDALLAEMNHTRSIVIFATNRPDMLDPALMRDKRTDCKIYVGRPNQEASAKIIESNLKDVPLEETATELAEYAASKLFSSDRALYEIKRQSTGEIIKFTLGNLINGAMAANVAEKATSITFQRDAKNGTKTKTGKSEILQSIDVIFEENRHLNHTDEVLEFIRDFKDDISDIKPLRQSRG